LILQHFHFGRIFESNTKHFEKDTFVKNSFVIVLEFFEEAGPRNKWVVQLLYYNFSQCLRNKAVLH